MGPVWWWLPPAQAGAVAAVVAGQLLLTGRVGVVLPLLVLFLVAWLGLRAAGQRGDLSPAAQPVLLRVARRAGLCHAVVAGSAYALAWWAAPDAFVLTAAQLAWAAPAVGAVVGLVAAALTLCAADLARHQLDLPR